MMRLRFSPAWCRALLCAFILPINSSCSGQNPPEANSPLPVHRVSQLIEVIHSDNNWLKRRAVQELALAGRTDAPYRTALVDLLWDRKSESVRLLCIAEIANLRQIAATDLIKKLERPEQITYAVVLCLGRLGTNASRAVALVRALVSDPKTDQPLRITGQICLANMGIAPLENERSVLEVITQRNTGAKRAVYDLAMVRPTWPLSSEMVTELASRLSTESYDASMAALALPFEPCYNKCITLVHEYENGTQG